MMQYWALKSERELVEDVDKKVRDYDRYLEDIGRIERLSKAYEYLYGLIDGGYGLRKTGAQGEIVKISVNNFRAFVNNIHVLITQSKSYFEAQAANMDTKTQAQTITGKAVVDYYLDEHGIEQDFSQCVLYTLAFAEHFLEVDWDESKGEDVGFGDELRKTGDITIKMHNCINVIRDISLKNHKENKWYIVRQHMNKWDLAATYPEHAAYIMEQTRKPFTTDSRRDSIYRKIMNYRAENDDTVEVRRVYHDDTISCIGGRDILIIGDKVIYSEALISKYKKNPIHRLAAQDIEGSFLAYSPVWDLISICQASDHLTTAQITNAINLAFTNIWSQDPNLKVSQLSSAMGLISSATEPKALNLASSSPELEKTLNSLHQKAQFLTGINSVAAGQPEAVSNIKSGNGLALILSTAVQFQHTIQERYAKFRSNVMSSVVYTLQKNADYPMLITVTGSSKASYVKKFMKDDISEITSVRLTLQSPIMSTTGGRVEVSNNIKNMFPESVSIDAYVNVLETGNLDHLKSNKVNSRQSILAENEKLQIGEQVQVVILENHKLHIDEHLALIATPEAKDDPVLVQVVSEHIFEHISKWKEMSSLYPELCAVIGIPPIAPPMAAMPMAGMPTPQGPEKAIEETAMSPISPDLPSMPNLPKAAPEGIGAAYDQVKQPEMAMN